MTTPTADAKASIPEASGIPEMNAEESNSTGSRRRGRRGGRRDRGERNENPPEAQTSKNPLPVAQPNDDVAVGAVLAPEVNAEAAEPQTFKTAAAPEADPPAIAPPVIEEFVVAPLTSVAPSETVGSAEIAAVESDIETALIEVVATPINVVESAIVEPIYTEPSSSVDTTPYVDIEKALETSGLVIVETISEKAKEWQPEMVSSEVPPRPRRVRPTTVATPDEPLIMVETNHE